MRIDQFTRSSCGIRYRHQRPASGVLIALSCAILSSLGTRAEIQNDAIGFTANHVFASAFAGETVDPLSGNLAIQIPLGPRLSVTDAFGYQLALSYNSRIWHHDCRDLEQAGLDDKECDGMIEASDTYGLGFRLSFGRIYQHGDRTVQNVVANPQYSHTYTGDGDWVYRYQSPDGAEKMFCWYSQANPDKCIARHTDGVGNFITRSILGKAVDGSGMRFEKIDSTWYAYPGDGTKVVFGHYVSSPPEQSGWHATRIETIARNGAGNAAAWLEIAYGGGDDISVITDSAERTITLNTVDDVTTITFPGTGGQYRLVREADITIHDTVERIGQGAAPINTATADVLARIEYPELDPDDSQRFEYAAGSSNYGEVVRRVLSTGAIVDYAYGRWKPLDRPWKTYLVSRTVTLAEALDHPYTWTYSRDWPFYHSTNPQVAGVVDPFGNLTRYVYEGQFGEELSCVSNVCFNNWDDGLLVRKSVYIGNFGDEGRLVEETTFEYDGEDMFNYRAVSGPTPWSGYAVGVNPKRIAETTTYPGSAGYPNRTRRTEYSDWVDETVPRRVLEFSDGVLVRATYTDATPTTAFRGAHNYVEVRDAIGQLVSRTDRVFQKHIVDGYATLTGRIECEIERAGAYDGPPLTACPEGVTSDVITTNMFDVDTNDIVTTTISGASPSASSTRHFTYENGELTSSGFGALSWKSIDRVVDPLTGRVSQTKDPAGHRTTYEWDHLGRLRWIRPATPEVPTEITYPTLLEARVRREVNASNYLETVHLYDSLGREIETRRRNADEATGYDFQKAEYDIAGRELRRSKWARAGTTAAELKWTVTDYIVDERHDINTGAVIRLPDPLGRPQRITAPDGSTTRYAYYGLTTVTTQAGIRGVDDVTGVGSEVAVTTRMEDALRRLVEVRSPGNGAKANYSYDALDRLREVRLIDPSDATRAQVRWFEYNVLGRLTSESNPESGIVQYLQYDARGNLVKERDGRGQESTYFYDDADRLLRKQVKAGSVYRDVVVNTYDVSPDGFAPAVPGRLATQVNYRINTGIPGTSGSPILVAIRRFAYGSATTGGASSCFYDGTSYSGLNGRPTWERVAVGAWSGADVQTDYCQDALGQESIVAYPAPITAAGGGGWMRSTARQTTVLATQYQNGWATAISDIGRHIDYATSLAYDASGAPVWGGRGVGGLVDETLRDAQGRPREIRVLAALPPGQSPTTYPGCTEGGMCAPPPPGYEIRWTSGTYGYDGAGNIAVVGANQYYYDALTRLVRGSVVAGVTMHTQSYEYDAFGNIENNTTDVSGAVTEQRDFTIGWQKNRLTSQVHARSGMDTETVTYEFDDAGNMVREGTRNFGINAEGRLEKITDDATGLEALYYYDARGQRVFAQSSGSETFYFRGPDGQVLSEFRRKAVAPDVPATDPTWDKDYVYVHGKAYTLIKNDRPAPPRKPWVESIVNNVVDVRWHAVEEPDLGFYEVLRTRDDPDKGITEILHEEPGTQMLDNLGDPPSANTVVRYQLWAIDTANNYSDPAPTLVVRPGAGPPPAPTNVRVQVSDGVVRVYWDPVPRDDVFGYWVWRQDVNVSPPGAFHRLNGAALQESEYIDSTASNVSYKYVVYCESTSRVMSAASSEVTATPSDATPPSAPTGVEAVPEAGAQHVVVSWRANPEADVLYYEIRRRSDSSESEVLDTVFRSHTSKIDGSATEGRTWYYKVAALDERLNRSAYSVEVAVQPRSGTIQFPIQASGQFEIDPGEPVDPFLANDGWVDDNDDGTPEGNVNGGQVSAEDDDVLQAHLHWTLNGSVNGFHVYRDDGDGTFRRITLEEPQADGDGGSPECTRRLEGDARECVDRTPTLANSFRYQIVAVDASGTESIANGEVEPTGWGSLPTSNWVRNVVAMDSSPAYMGYPYPLNYRSRYVEVRWSRLLRTKLRGYHVYRKCEVTFFEGSGIGSNNSTDVCERRWVRLNRRIIPPDSTRFIDWTTNGFGGVYVYAVRPVFDKRPTSDPWQEGPIKKAVAVNLNPHCGHTVPAYHTDADVWVNDEYVWPLPPTSDELASINSIGRGSGDPDEPLTAPNYGYWLQWLVSDHLVDPPQSGIQASSISARITIQYQPPLQQPSDLAGFRLEMAGSPSGPWEPALENVIPWWETVAPFQQTEVRNIGTQIGRTSPAVYSGSSCRFFRAFAVDEDGNESPPFVLPYNVGECGTAPTPEAPANLRAESVNETGAHAICKTRLTWDPVPGAVYYHVYRYKQLGGDSYTYFYKTQTQWASCDPTPPNGEPCGTTYLEAGDPPTWVTPPASPPYSPFLGNSDCPYVESTYQSQYNCDMAGHQEAYYVTAQGLTGGESPRSNVVTWNCDLADGGVVAQAVPGASRDAVAAMNPGNGAPEVNGAGGDLEASLECKALPPRPPAKVCEWNAGGADVAADAARNPTRSAGMVVLGGVDDPPWVVFNLHTDHLGSIRLETDATGAVVATHDFLPFGEEIQAIRAFNTHMFTGHERDRETGLDYMFARYYRPSEGRFRSMDPLLGPSYDPPSQNRCAYVRDNPLNLTDPKGLYWAPGTPMPIIPGDPNGCTLCHDFVGGTAEQRAWAYAQQRELRDRASRRVKRFFAHLLGMKLDDALTPGHGVTIDLDRLPKNRGAGETTEGGGIRLNIALLFGNADLFQTNLLHETGHLAALLKFGDKSDDSVVWPGLRDSIDRQVPNRWSAFLLMMDGYIGYAAEELQYGHVENWRH